MHLPLVVSSSTASRAPIQAADYLVTCRDAVLAAAEAELNAGSPKYAHETEPVLRDRLLVLYEKLVESLAAGCLLPILDHAHEIAAERFHGGYDLSEVQKAYNAVEEAIWSRVFAEGAPEQYAIVLPWVSAAIGAAKDELAREYVKLAASAHAPAIDVAALFRGGVRL